MLPRAATIVPCRAKDCPSKTRAEKKWCLIDSNDVAKRCAPTKEECKEQERNINYFKHAGVVRRAMALHSREARVLWLRQALAAGYRPGSILYHNQLWVLV